MIVYFHLFLRCSEAGIYIPILKNFTESYPVRVQVSKTMSHGGRGEQVWENSRSCCATDCGVRLLSTDLVDKHSP
jgi:hypothetical protein